MRPFATPLLLLACSWRAAIATEVAVVDWAVPGEPFPPLEVNASTQVEFLWDRNTSNHNLFRLPNAEAFAACNFEGTEELCGQISDECIIAPPEGTSYYACRIAGHCVAGQKIAITTTAAPTPPPTTPPTPPPFRTMNAVLDIGLSPCSLSMTYALQANAELAALSCGCIGVRMVGDRWAPGDTDSACSLRAGVEPTGKIGVFAANETLLLLEGSVSGLEPNCQNCSFSVRNGFSCNSVLGFDSFGSEVLYEGTYSTDDTGAADIMQSMDNVGGVTNSFNAMGHSIVFYGSTRTSSPTPSPTSAPTGTPSVAPTLAPTLPPTNATEAPTDAPSETPTSAPTVPPTNATEAPTSAPSPPPSSAPTSAPSIATTAPTDAPSVAPTASPEVVTISPAVGALSDVPSVTPTESPSIELMTGGGLPPLRRLQLDGEYGYQLACGRIIPLTTEDQVDQQYADVVPAGYPDNIPVTLSSILTPTPNSSLLAGLTAVQGSMFAASVFSSEAGFVAARKGSCDAPGDYILSDVNGMNFWPNITFPASQQNAISVDLMDFENAVTDSAAYEGMIATAETSLVNGTILGCGTFAEADVVANRVRGFIFMSGEAGEGRRLQDGAGSNVIASVNGLLAGSTADLVLDSIGSVELVADTSGSATGDISSNVSVAEALGLGYTITDESGESLASGTVDSTAVAPTIPSSLTPSAAPVVGGSLTPTTLTNSPTEFSNSTMAPTGVSNSLALGLGLGLGLGIPFLLCCGFCLGMKGRRANEEPKAKEEPKQNQSETQGDDDFGTGMQKA